MYNVIIIGVGQLGSRHLQGLKKAQSALNIWCVDNNTYSLQIAKERYEEIPTGINKEIHFVQSMESLPFSIDLAIVATSSQSRAFVIKSLLERCEVKHLILEKFLFPRLEEYSVVQQLLDRHNIAAWVNCPRRMFDYYYQLKNRLHSESMDVSYEAKDWGLCCNSIHFIDLLMYLTGEEDYNIDVSELHPVIYPSKRDGYIELKGTIKIETPTGSIMKLSSTEDYEGRGLLKVSTRKSKTEFIVDEVDGIWSENGIVGCQNRTPFQSELTGVLADEILQTGTCRLTTYPHSSVYHQKFLRVIIDFVNQLQGRESDSCPIT